MLVSSKCYDVALLGVRVICENVFRTFCLPFTLLGFERGGAYYYWGVVVVVVDEEKYVKDVL